MRCTQDFVLLPAPEPQLGLVKDAGGIRTLDDAQRFLERGTSRLGTSAIVELIKE